MPVGDYLGPGAHKPGLLRGWAEVWHRYAWLNSLESLIYVCVCVSLCACWYSVALIQRVWHWQTATAVWPLYLMDHWRTIMSLKQGVNRSPTTHKHPHIACWIIRLILILFHIYKQTHKTSSREFTKCYFGVMLWTSLKTYMKVLIVVVFIFRKYLNYVFSAQTC